MLCAVILSIIMLRTVILVVIFLAAVSAFMLTVIKPNAIRLSVLSIIRLVKQCLMALAVSTPGKGSATRSRNDFFSFFQN